MASVVRSSKFRHVFGTAAKRNDSFENLRVSASAWDSNFVAANPKYLAVNWDAGGGGAFCVVPQAQVGKLRADFPLFSAHQGAVLDTAFSPFDDDVIASGAEDHQAMVWRIPGDLEEREENVTEPLAVLKGHGRKVGHVAWNPVAAGVLAVSSSDNTVRLWDVEAGRVGQTLQGFDDAVLSIAWSGDGTQLAATCRDKQLRIFDARSGRVERAAPSHTGIKGSRVAWLGDTRLATTGFARGSGRELRLWDASTLTPISTQNVDSSAGMLMPFFDSGTSILYVAGKGDGNIRYYEFADDKLYYLSEFQSPDPQRGMCAMPKRSVDVARCEVMRFFKVVSGSLVEPISFRVPRKAESFQADIYPPAHAGQAAMSADEFFAGKCAQPVLADMEQVFRDGPLVVGAGSSGAAAAPVVVSAPSPAAAPEPKKAPTPEPRKAPTPEPKKAPAPEPVPAPEVKPEPKSEPKSEPKPESSADAAELASLRQETARLRAELDQQRAAAADAAARERTAQQQLEQATQQLADNTQVSAKLQAAASDAESLRAQLDAASAQADEFRTQLAQAATRATEHEQATATLQQDLQAAISAANALALAAEKAADSLQ